MAECVRVRMQLGSVLKSNPLIAEVARMPKSKSNRIIWCTARGWQQTQQACSLPLRHLPQATPRSGEE